LWRIENTFAVAIRLNYFLEAKIKFLTALLERRAMHEKRVEASYAEYRRQKVSALGAPVPATSLLI
jgi:hypothetical protein